VVCNNWCLGNGETNTTASGLALGGGEEKVTAAEVGFGAVLVVAGREEEDGEVLGECERECERE